MEFGLLSKGCIKITIEEKLVAKHARISVVIPAYNREQSIQRCIMSIHEQTYPVTEILIVDDCSTDHTADIVREIANMFPAHYIRYIRLEKNAGAQVARNTGIKAALGAWIAFCDSDDIWLKDKLEKQMQALACAGYAEKTVIHGDCLVVNCITGEEHPWHLPEMDGENVYKALLQSSGPMFQAFLTSKAALLQAGLLDEKVPSYQEWDTSLLLAKKCRFIHIHEPLFVYYIHDTDFRNPQRDFAGYQYIIKKYQTDIINICGIGTWNRHMEIQFIKCILMGDFAKAASLVREFQDTTFIYLSLLKWICLTKGRGLRFLQLYHFFEEEGAKGVLKRCWKKNG